MGDLDDAMTEIHRAQDGVSETDVQTELQSIAASLQELSDAEAGERTDGEVAFADSDFVGADPDEDTLQSLERQLDTLAENVDRDGVREHLRTARDRLAAYRAEREDGE